MERRENRTSQHFLGRREQKRKSLFSGSAFRSWEMPGDSDCSRFFTLDLSTKPLPILMSWALCARRSPLKYRNKNPVFSKQEIIYLFTHSSYCYNALLDALAESKIFHPVANMKIISRFFESLFWISLIACSVSFCNVPYTKPFIHHLPAYVFP